MAEREAPTLGGLVGCWIQERLAIPDGERQGEPFLLTAEQWAFVLHYYRLDGRGQFVYRRGGLLVRPAKHGKGPLSAALIAAEALGPVRFAGWDSNGEPVGKPPASPWIQVVAVSEDQTANVWRALLPMLELGNIAHEVEHIGLTRVTLPGAGRVEFCTAAHRSRVGQRVTFVVMDELGFWLPGNHGHELADAVLRNLAGMGGRFLGTTNSWSLNEQSVAERLAGAGAGVYVDDVEPGPYSIRNKAERRKALRRVYGDSAAGAEAQGGASGWIEPWIDLDRIDAEVEALIDRDESQARRFFFNEKRAADASAFDIHKWNGLVREGYRPAEKAKVVIGVDGARNRDAIAVVVCEPETGFVWAELILERPEDAGEDYEHDLDRVDGVVAELFQTYTVERVLVDPFGLDPLLERWEAHYGTPPVFRWQMNRPRQVSYAVRALTEAINGGDLLHDGDPAFTAHVKNAVRRPVNVLDDSGTRLWTVSKDGYNSPRKIDAAAALVLAWEARGVVASAPTPPRAVEEVGVMGISRLSWRWTDTGEPASWQDRQRYLRELEAHEAEHGKARKSDSSSANAMVSTRATKIGGRR